MALSIQEYAYDTWRTTDDQLVALRKASKDAWSDFNRLSDILDRKQQNGDEVLQLEMLVNHALQIAQDATEAEYSYIEAKCKS